ncbi:MAG: stage V sporulation protein AC [Sulfobacillus thermosulfidooxidans]|uniref:Stage V sporulation protein AC n=1 Tax=Sulfobacillus thermotolerans TaxID=338644 RepID=A0ABM6RQD9_9FIRM|nr:stage V sporulation protein AC [Sulfobacillus sp. hq2]AUW93627.1 stage V sporulation protein AC [Sulfobacillus thermotolerans]MCY0907027.1 stage V sporulation protein AC [Sulfobacillus thermotolerans]POB10870.1 stage V sporulation protein AC [Sulfobacillus sp. hq2]PSR33361.1 MAG: stage V sporulation protein AC [Sulfobacillus thermosulfidooxidans]
MATKSQHQTDEMQEYQKMAQEMRPKKPLLKNVLLAFFIGGFISEVGQGVQWFFMQHGMSAKEATSPVTVVMIGLGALLTGLGWYDRVVKYGGMGGSLPVTGFANAMVAPAMEFRTEGLVLGVGAKLFTVAGPVLAYGLAAAFVVGLIRWLVTGVA